MTTYLLQLTNGEYVGSPANKTTTNTNFAASFAKQVDAEVKREAWEIMHGPLEVVAYTFKSFLS